MDRYTSKRWNLERNADFNEAHASLQMFGFFRGRYAVSQRTINESAQVLDFIIQHP